MQGKNIAGILFIVLAIGIGLYGHFIYEPSSSCTGLGNLNPICWISHTWNWVLEFFFIILAVWTFLAGIMVIGFDESKTGYVIGFWLLLPLAIANVFIPDPIPFVDEMIMGVATAFVGVKTLGAPAAVKEKIPMF